MVYGSGAVVAVDGLRIHADALHVGDVGVGDPGGAAVQGDAALLAERGVAMDIEVVEHEMVRHLREQGLRRSPAPSAMMSPKPRLVGAELQSTAAASDARRRRR